MPARISAVLVAILMLCGPTPGFAQGKGKAKGKGQARTNPSVELVTSMGNIQVELYPAKAGKTVENFLVYVKSGQYDGTIFHRVIANFMIQGGGYDAKYDKRPTRPAIKNEADNGLKNLRGTIAMARTSDPHSATGQFFINVKDNDALDHRSKDEAGWGYCVFGKVVKGMDTVDKIRNVKTGSKGPFDTDAPQKEVVIKKVRLL